MIPARISPAAANDLLDIADYLEGESFSIALGRAFLKKAAATVARIESNPELGRIRPSSRQNLSGLRSLGIDKPFSKYLVFYRIDTKEILVVRVLHGSQDLKKIIKLVS